MTRLYLLRHGSTESNRVGRYMSRSEEGLSGDGRWQVRQLAQRMACSELTAVYSSPLQRAQETAQIVAQPHRLNIEIAPEFNELDLSRWAGLTATEIASQDPEAWDIWCNDPRNLSVSGIESFVELQNRIRKGLQEITTGHPRGRIAVATHDGIIRIAVLLALGISMDNYRAITVSNTGMTILDIGPTRTYLRAFNDTGHLEDALGTMTGPADQ